MEKQVASSPLRLIQAKHEWISIYDIAAVPKGLRGIYVLYHTTEQEKKKALPRRSVVYIGMSTTGIRSRLLKHAAHEAKKGRWDTCSIYTVWPNIRNEEIVELEGILRHIYRVDPDAQKLNTQGTYKALQKLRNTLVE
ncbi:hypothetical protein LBW56_13920 [Ralstonia solanacearum]|uniref:hypothetical protein n=1 Tax=Ralstonia solanacearum TaxID=305 RepID=UPI001FF774D6|nr:hypothetical protein [Ralstonia solanacearum]MDB0527790.1 hypothetical protein [Ralstonia solanacearum]